MASCTMALSATSQDSTRLSEPSLLTSADTCLQPSVSMSASTTRAPSSAMRRAVAAPMPLPAPVTKATRPSSRPMYMYSLRQVLLLQDALVQCCQKLHIVAGLGHVLQQCLHCLQATLIGQR